MTSLKAKRVQLYAASFFLDAAGHAYPLLVSAHVQAAFGASPLELGILGSVAPLVYAVACLVTGGWSDRAGSMPLVWWGLALLGLVVFPVALASSSLTPLYFTHAGFGICLALFWPPLQRELSLLSPGETLWRSLGAFNLSWAAGAGLGTLVGGPDIYARFGFKATVGSVIAIVLLSLASTAGRAPRGRAGRVDGAGLPAERQEAWLFLRLAWVSNFCASLAMGGVHNVFVYVAKRLELAGGWATAILYAKEVGRLVAFAFLRRRAGWHYSLAWLAILQLAGGGALVWSGFVAAPWLLLSLFFVLGVFSGLTYYSSIYYSLNLRADEGKKSGIHEGILAVGVVLGPLSCGAAGHLFPGWPGAVLLAPGAAILAGLAVELILVRREARNGAGSG